LTFGERRALTAHWMEVARGSELKVIVHVGSNSLDDARALAAQARSLEPAPSVRHTPCYFKPASVAVLVECIAGIASAAAELPFYYYEIPSLTGVTLVAIGISGKSSDRIPNLAGIKFSSNNMMEYQLCRSIREGAFDIPFGIDEMLMAALALGATGAVRQHYNFAAPLYLRLIAAFRRGDLAAARVNSCARSSWFARWRARLHGSAKR